MTKQNSEHINLPISVMLCDTWCSLTPSDVSPHALGSDTSNRLLALGAMSMNLAGKPEGRKQSLLGGLNSYPYRYNHRRDLAKYMGAGWGRMRVGQNRPREICTCTQKNGNGR